MQEIIFGRMLRLKQVFWISGALFWKIFKVRKSEGFVRTIKDSQKV